MRTPLFSSPYLVCITITSCLLCFTENPFPLCDYSHRVNRLIYISNGFLNWGQVEVHLLRYTEGSLKNTKCWNEMAAVTLRKDAVALGSCDSYVMDPVSVVSNFTEYLLSYMSWGGTVDQVAFLSLTVKCHTADDRDHIVLLCQKRLHWYMRWSDKIRSKILIALTLLTRHCLNKIQLS